MDTTYSGHNKDSIYETEDVHNLSGSGDDNRK